MSQSSVSRNLTAGHVWQTDAWRSNMSLTVGDDGRWTDATASSDESIGEWVLPGMPNLHSHAFQRAMAGLAERKDRADDSFWSWRETMYAFASTVGPEQLQAIAAQLYVEMLKAGYTHVCEFHYLHHQPNGTPFEQPETMSLALIEAAREAGIGLTLLPVLYMSGGFDQRALSERQRRFGHTVESYLRLLETLRGHESDSVSVGAALHSLRAVPVPAMNAVLADKLLADCPIHIHIAEQIGEVQDCVATRGARPVAWLFDHAPIDSRWCLVHATHLTDAETLQIAQSGAVAGLCPTTEANLGDGLFPLTAYQNAGGTLGIGSDSHISVSPVEELRWLEYGQRLKSRHRNIAAREQGDSVGETLWQACLAGGRQAAGLRTDALGHGSAADLIVLDENSAWLAARDTHSMMDSLLFAGNASLVRDVMVGGRWVVRDLHHHDEERIAARYRDTVTALLVG